MRRGVQGIKRDQLRDFGFRVLVEVDGMGEVFTALDDAVTNAGNFGKVRDDAVFHEGFEKKVNSDRVVGEGEDLGDFLAPELDGEDAIIVADALGHAGTEDFLLRHFEKLVLERAAARIDCHAFCHNWFDSPCLPKREEFIR